jgi:hypothetical protein
MCCPTGPPGIGGSYASSVRGSSANYAGGGAAAAAQLLVGSYAAASGVAHYALGATGGAPSSRNSLSTAHWGVGPSSVLGWGGSQGVVGWQLADCLLSGHFGECRRTSQS